MHIDYYIKVNGIIERGNFYNYMKSLKFKDHILLDRQTMIESSYPFAICLKKKEIMIVESATLCYYADKNGTMINEEEFKEILKKQSYAKEKK